MDNEALKQKISLKKKIFRWIKVIVLLYSIIGIAMYYLQDFKEGSLEANFDFKIIAITVQK